MTVRLVDHQSEEEREHAISALVLAFIRDPVMRWMYPEPKAYLRHFPGFARAFGGPAFGSGTAWAGEDYGGASLWFPKNVAPDGAAIEKILFATIAESKHETMREILEKMEAYHPEEPHWYLAIVGVDAAHQGRGLGAKLLQCALERCDEEGLIGYLESSNPANISLYERHGFEVVGEIRCGEAPPVFPMLRAAR